MPQSLCTLGSVTFPYNAYPYQAPLKRAAQYQETLGGGYVTDYGYLVQDTLLKLEWAIIERTFYNQLLGLYTASSAQYSFTDPYGTNMTVFIEDLTPKSLLMGGDDAVEGAALSLRVVSIP